VTRFRWGSVSTEVDEAAVRQWYGAAPQWNCACGHCRNFVELARRRALPDALLELLDRLSVPPEKASYVCELYDKDGRLFYEAAYRLAGRVLSGPERSTVPFGDIEILCGRETAPGTAERFPEPYFDLECYLWLPWALDEPIAGPEP